jgi:hypothetical protein
MSGAPRPRRRPSPEGTDILEGDGLGKLAVSPAGVVERWVLGIQGDEPNATVEACWLRSCQGGPPSPFTAFTPPTPPVH